MNAPTRRGYGAQRGRLDSFGQEGRRAPQPSDFDRPDGYHPSRAQASFEGLPKNPAAAAPTAAKTGASMLNMTLPSDFTRERQARAPKPKRHVLRSIRKWSVRGAIGLVVIVLLVGGFLFSKGYLTLHSVFRGGNKSIAALGAKVDPSALSTEGDSRINILLLGIGGDGHDGPDLTDTILLASIDPVNHKMGLVSVPRDLWVTVPGHGSMKINAAYETGKYAYLHQQSDSNANPQAVQAGFNSVNSVVSQVLGVKINYNALVNFKAFQQAVNAVGGVTVNVPTTLYDPTMAWENGGNPVLAKAGVQTFDGWHALMYVRSRETTSDFARTQRQRAVLVALGQKVFSLGTLSNPLKISQLIGSFGSNVATNISLNDISRLYAIVKAIPSVNIQSIGLADPPNNYVTTGMIGSQSVVRPVAGLGNYAAIQQYVRSQLVDGYIAKEHAEVAVLSGTGDAALANAKADVLRSYGYNVGSVGLAPTANYNKTVVVDLSKGKDPYTAHYLSRRFNVSITTKLPNGAIHPGTAQFVVILGRDQQ